MISSKKVLIIGLGLIGGSLARALRPCCLNISAIDVNENYLKHARENHWIDSYCLIDQTELFNKTVAAADIIILSVPLSQYGKLLARIAVSLQPHTVISDVGSVKQLVVIEIQTQFPNLLPQFIPGHPIAGSDVSGIYASQPHFFQNKPIIICRLPENLESSYQQITTMWRAVGGHIFELGLSEHDKLFSKLSHLPHVLAFSYIHSMFMKTNLQANAHLAGSGFRDFSRIAGADSNLWRTICFANKEAVLDDIATFKESLDLVETALRNNDQKALSDVFEFAQNSREKWAKQTLSLIDKK